MRLKKKRLWFYILIILIIIALALTAFIAYKKISLSPRANTMDLPCGIYDSPACSEIGQVRCDGNTYCRCETTPAGKRWRGPYICPEGYQCRAGQNGGCVSISQENSLGI